MAAHDVLCVCASYIVTSRTTAKVRKSSSLEGQLRDNSGRIDLSLLRRRKRRRVLLSPSVSIPNLHLKLTQWVKTSFETAIFKRALMGQFSLGARVMVWAVHCPTNIRPEKPGGTTITRRMLYVWHRGGSQMRWPSWRPLRCCLCIVDEAPRHVRCVRHPAPGVPLCSPIRAFVHVCWSRSRGYGVWRRVWSWW